ncbi:MAG: ABC-2 transporter permease [Coprobacillus sp.]
MMGLLIKDFKLLKQQRNMLLIMIAISLMLVATGNDVSFVMSYLTFIATFFVTSTISYDEYNKSNIFLFTLPVSRKEYVQEKYFLGILVCSSIWFLTTVLCTFYQMNNVLDFAMLEWLGMALLILCIPLITLSFMIPTQLKYGGEKGRIAMIAVVGIAFIIGFGFIMLCQYLNIDVDALLNSVSNTGVVIGGVVLTAIVGLISYCVSKKVMDNKEF